jgi:hypothetical protein
VRIGTGQESGLLRFRDYLEFNLFDDYEVLLRNHEVQVQFADGSVVQAKSDADGRVHIGDCPPGPVTLTYEKVPRDPSETGFAAGSGYDIDKAVSCLNANGNRTNSLHLCATYVRKAILAGGIDINPRPVPAKDYGPYLLKYNFTKVDVSGFAGYNPLKGDISVIQSYPGGSKYGHITMFNGSQWVSDFIQTDMWSGNGYRTNQPGFEIFRWEQ